MSRPQVLGKLHMGERREEKQSWAEGEGGTNAVSVQPTADHQRGQKQVALQKCPMLGLGLGFVPLHPLVIR